MNQRYIFAALTLFAMATTASAPAAEAQVHYYRPMHMHWVNGFYGIGDFVELGDGSQWKISYDDTYKTIHWKVGDPIIITHNDSWFSSYNYFLTNEATGSYVKASLQVGPVTFGPYTHWVVGFDRAKKQVYLENGTCWEVSDLGDWAINDTVMIGINDSFWWSYFDTLLINVNRNLQVYARQF